MSSNDARENPGYRYEQWLNRTGRHKGVQAHTATAEERADYRTAKQGESPARSTDYALGGTDPLNRSAGIYPHDPELAAKLAQDIGPPFKTKYDQETVPGVYRKTPKSERGQVDRSWRATKRLLLPLLAEHYPEALEIMGVKKSGINQMLRGKTPSGFNTDHLHNRGGGGNNHPFNLVFMRIHEHDEKDQEVLGNSVGGLSPRRAEATHWPYTKYPIHISKERMARHDGASPSDAAYKERLEKLFEPTPERVKAWDRILENAERLGTEKNSLTVADPARVHNGQPLGDYLREDVARSVPQALLQQAAFDRATVIGERNEASNAGTKPPTTMTFRDFMHRREEIGR